MPQATFTFPLGIVRRFDENGRTVDFIVENRRGLKDSLTGDALHTKSLEKALEACGDLDVYNQYRAQKSAAKRQVITDMFQRMYGNRGVNLVVADSLAAMQNPAVRAKFAANRGARAAYEADDNTVYVLADQIQNLGQLYTDLAHERSHVDIAEHILGKSGGAETDAERQKLAEGRERLFGGAAGAEANEEAVAERTSVNEILKAVRDSNRSLPGAVAAWVRGKISEDTGFALDSISDADVRTELKFLADRGYLGQSAEVKGGIAEETDAAALEDVQTRSNVAAGEMAEAEARRKANERQAVADKARGRAARREQGREVARVLAEDGQAEVVPPIDAAQEERADRGADMEVAMEEAGAEIGRGREQRAVANAEAARVAKRKKDFEAALNDAEATTKQEKPNETGNGADEAPAQPEQGGVAGRPAQGEAARPVEGAETRQEAANARVVAPQTAPEDLSALSDEDLEKRISSLAESSSPEEFAEKAGALVEEQERRDMAEQEAKSAAKRKPTEKERVAAKKAEVAAKKGAAKEKNSPKPTGKTAEAAKPVNEAPKTEASATAPAAEETPLDPEIAALPGGAFRYRGQTYRTRQAAEKALAHERTVFRNGDTATLREGGETLTGQVMRSPDGSLSLRVRESVPRSAANPDGVRVRTVPVKDKSKLVKLIDSGTRFKRGSAPAGVQKSADVEYPDAGREISGIRFKVGAKRREEYARQLAKHRPDLDANAVLDEIDKFDEPKKEKAALHWVVRGAIRLPEDAYKVEDALSVAEKAKVDPFAYKSPLELIEAHKDIKPTRRAIDPATVPELSDPRDEGDGIVSYEVADTREGQAAMRRIIDTHWGEDANPWCLLAYDGRRGRPTQHFLSWLGRENYTDEDIKKYNEEYTLSPLWSMEESLGRAWDYWQHYSALPKRVAFKNGRLLAFMATEDKGDDAVNLEDRLEELRSEIRGESGMVETGNFDREDEYWTAKENDDQKTIDEIVEEWDEWVDGEAFSVIYSYPDRNTATIQNWNGDTFFEEDDSGNQREYRRRADGSYVFGGEPQEEWWDRQDESHPDLDWARGGDASGTRFKRNPAFEHSLDALQAIADGGPSVKHIGTGEGSQVYGWGLYGSTVRGVAEGYATLNSGAYLKTGKPISDYFERTVAEALDDYGWDVAKTISGLQEKNKTLGTAARKENNAIIKELRAHGEEYRRKSGSIYEQTFFTNRAEGDESHLLKWYEPVGEENVKRVLDQYAKEHDGADLRADTPSGTITLEDFGDRKLFADALKENADALKEDGASLYRYVSGVLGSEQAASEFLARAGIDGVKYPVDSFGGKGVKDGDKAGWNYVSFRDDNIRVDHKWTDGQMRFKRSAAELQRDYDEVVRRYTNADGTKKRGWMHAPNGQPTRLTERQWVQVRTPAFKEWFGDWESAARRLLMDAAKVARIAQGAFKKLGDKSIQQTASEMLKDPVVHKTEIGDITIDKRSAHDSLAHRYSQKKLDALVTIQQDFANAVYLGSERDFDVKDIMNHYFAYPIAYGEDGERNLVFCRAREDKNANRLYVHEVFLESELKNNGDALQAAAASSVKDASRTDASPSASPRGIALARIILQRLFADNGASRVVDENGEPLVVWHGSRWRPLEEAPGDAVFGKSKTASRGSYLKDRQGFFFANKDVSEDYQGGSLGTLTAYFINARNPYVVDVRDELRELDYDIETERGEAEAAGYPIGRWLGEGNVSFEANDSATAYLDDNMYEIMDRADESEADAVLVRGADGSFVTVAFEPNQIKSATDNTGAFDGAEDDIRFKIVGERGAANLGITNLGDAERMEKDGASREDIWRKTGWWRGRDGKWRVEIPDVKRKRWDGDPEERHFMGGGEDFYRYRLTELIEDGDFLKAYPKARDIVVEFHKNMPANVGGNFNEATLTVKMPQKFHLAADWAKEGLGDGKSAELNEAGRKTIVHELQHAIQLFEGFAKGGSPTEPVRPYALDGETGHALSVFGEAVGLDPTNDRHLRNIANWAQKITSDYTKGDVPQWIVESFEAAAKEAGKTPQEFRDEIERLYDSHTETPLGQYIRLEGEVEARNVKERLNMTPEARAAIPPWKTEDVAEASQIVRFKRNAAFEHSLDALQAIASGAGYGVLHNAKYGEIRYPLGKVGRITESGKTKEGLGLLHIVSERMRKDGATLDEALDVAIKVGQAAEIGEETNTAMNTHWLDYDGVRAIVAETENGNPIITGYEIRADETPAAFPSSDALQRQPVMREADIVAALRNRIANLRAESQGGIRFKSAPRAAVDDPDVLFGARESRKAHGLDDLTAEESRLAYTDKELYAAGQRIAKDVPHMLNVVNDALTSDRALPLEDTFALTVFLRNQMDALADVHAKMQNGNAASFKAEEEYLSAIVEKASKAVARNNTKLAGLRVARLGVMLDTARDTEAWLTQEVRTRRAAQGLPPEPSESDKAMIKRMAEQLKKANEENEALRKQIADLQSERVTERRAKENVAKGKSAARGAKVQQSSPANRRADFAKKYNAKVSDSGAKAWNLLARMSGRKTAMFKGGGSGLTADMMDAFAQIVEDFGGDYAGAESAIKAEMPDMAEAFAQFRSSMENRGKGDLATLADNFRKEVVPRRAAELANLALPVTDQRLVTTKDLGEAREEAKRKLDENAGDPYQQRIAIGHYLRRYMDALINENPDVPMKELQEKMAEEATALTGTKHDPVAMLAVMAGVDGYDLETRAEIQRKIAKAQHALDLFRQGKVNEAARESGLLYEDEATALEQMENALRQIITEKADEIDYLSTFSEKNAEAVERVKQLKADLKESNDALKLMRKEISLAERKAKFAEVLEKRIAEAQKAADALRGEVESEDFAERKARAEAKVEELKAALAVAKRDEMTLKKIKDKIAEYEKRIADGDYDRALQTYRANDADLQAKLALARERRNELRRKLEAERRARNYRQMGVVGKTLYGLGGILGEMKGVVASFDLSSVLRQGGQLTWAHPFLAAKNLKETLKAWKDGDYADNLMAQLRMRPNWKYYEQAGIDFTDWGEGATNKEDMFLLNQYRRITNIKLLKKGVMASERAFSMFLNLMRADVFDAMANGSTFGSAANMNDSQLKALGRFINIATQRGAFEKGGKFANAIPALNTVLWSPRNVASRFQFLWETGKLLGGGNAYGDKTLRKLFAQELVRYIGGMSAAAMFLKAVAELFRDDDDPPNETEFDPRSSDFLKVRFGNVRMDLTSGLTPILVFGARMFSGKTMNLRGQMRESNRLELMGRFARQKFAPAASLVYDMGIAREDFERRDIDYTSLWEQDAEHISALRYFVGSFVPLSGADLLEQAEVGGLPKTFVTGAMSLLGANVQAFDPYNYKQLKGDYTYFKGLYDKSQDPEERRHLVEYHPMLKRRERIEAVLKRVRNLENIKKKAEKSGQSRPDLDERIKEEKEIAIGVMAGIY